MARKKWAQEAERRRKLTEKARKLLMRADRRGVWIWYHEGVLWSSPPEAISSDFRDEIARFTPYLIPLVEGRRTYDGQIDSRLVVFLDPLKAAVFAESDHCHGYGRGDFEVLDAEIAEALVETGVCAYHPGPEGN